MARGSTNNGIALGLLLLYFFLSLGLFIALAVYLNHLLSLQAKGDITYLQPTYTKFLFGASIAFAFLSFVGIIVTIVMLWPKSKGYVYRSTPQGSYLEEYTGSGTATTEETVSIADVSLAAQPAASPAQAQCRPRPTTVTSAVATTVAPQQITSAQGPAAAVVQKRKLATDIFSGAREESLYAGFDKALINF